MPVQLSLQFDGGEAKFQLLIDKTMQSLKDFTPFWEKVISYFEGTGQHGLSKGSYPSPIVEIYESEGAVINGKWGVTSAYAEWKEMNWQGARAYDVPVEGNSLQVLSGKTLNSLLRSDSPSAVRRKDAKSMEYGTSVPYAYDNQMARKILDFYPKMEDTVRRIYGMFLHDVDNNWEEDEK